MRRIRAAAAAKLLQSCPTLCDPIDSSPPGSPVPGILQARTPEWVAISFSNAWKWKVKGKLLSHVRLLATPWTAADQAPLSMGFSRQEYWSWVPLPSAEESETWSEKTKSHSKHVAKNWDFLVLLSASCLFKNIYWPFTIRKSSGTHRWFLSHRTLWLLESK